LVAVEVFKSEHRIPTVSYGFSEIKRKLKDEYNGLSSQEIVKLKTDKVEITREAEFKKFVFCGDTTEKIFTNDGILSYPDIIIECTYFKNNDLVMANKKAYALVKFKKNS
jgi:ribonuclease Z